MLRYFAQGPRDFRNWPVPVLPRLNWEFFAALEGYCRPILSVGKSTPLRTRTLWVFPANKHYGWEGEENPCDRAVFHFARVPTELEEAVKDRPYLSVELTTKEIESLRGSCAIIAEHYKTPNQLSHLYYEKILLELTLLVLKQSDVKGRSPLFRATEDRVERALAWYSIHMMRNPTVVEVAEAVFVSTGHLRRLFKQTQGRSPHAAFRELQIKRAVDLLATTSDTLDEIARMCGFRSTTDFARVFKNEVGSTADVWRRQLLQKEKNAGD